MSRSHSNSNPENFSESTDLELSEAQKETFAGWKRPSEAFGRLSDRRIEISMTAVNNIDLVQDITTDCSVVASLCAGTARALKGHGKVVNIPISYRLGC